MAGMASVFARFLYTTGQFFGLIFRLNLAAFFKKVCNTIYSGWLSGQVTAAGRINVESPAIIIGGQYITIGKGFSSRANLRIEAYDHFEGISYTPSVSIGNNVCFNFDCHLGCIDHITIKDNVLIGSRVLIIDHAHGKADRQALQLPPSLRPLDSKGPVIIEENVWIGEGVAILPNVTIGANSIIGANAVVTKSVPPNSVVMGTAARVYKTIDQ